MGKQQACSTEMSWLTDNLKACGIICLQATQEKVAALMQAADAKGNRRASGGGGKGPGNTSAKPGAPSGGWRVCSSTSNHCCADVLSQSPSMRE